MINDIYNRPFPVLDINEQYVLREQNIKDTESFFNYYSNPKVGQYILATHPRNVAEASAEIHYCRNLFKYKRGIYWSLARKADDAMIGAVGVYINNQHHRCEICYDLAQDYWKQGIMTQTLQKVIDFAFNKLGVFRIEAIILNENKASIAILSKLGFHHEGRLQNYRYFKGETYDVELYARVQEG